MHTKPSSHPSLCNFQVKKGGAPAKLKKPALGSGPPGREKTPKDPPPSSGGAPGKPPKAAKKGAGPSAATDAPPFGAPPAPKPLAARASQAAIKKKKKEASGGKAAADAQPVGMPQKDPHQDAEPPSDPATKDKKKKKKDKKKKKKKDGNDEESEADAPTLAPPPGGPAVPVPSSKAPSPSEEGAVAAEEESKSKKKKKDKKGKKKKKKLSPDGEETKEGGGDEEAEAKSKKSKKSKKKKSKITPPDEEAAKKAETKKAEKTADKKVVKPPPTADKAVTLPSKPDDARQAPLKAPVEVPAQPKDDMPSSSSTGKKKNKKIKKKNKKSKDENSDAAVNAPMPLAPQQAPPPMPAMPAASMMKKAAALPAGSPEQMAVMREVHSMMTQSASVPSRAAVMMSEAAALPSGSPQQMVAMKEVQVMMAQSASVPSKAAAMMQEATELPAGSPQREQQQMLAMEQMNAEVAQTTSAPSKAAVMMAKAAALPAGAEREEHQQLAMKQLEAEVTHAQSVSLNPVAASSGGGAEAGATAAVSAGSSAGGTWKSAVHGKEHASANTQAAVSVAKPTATPTVTVEPVIEYAAPSGRSAADCAATLQLHAVDLSKVAINLRKGVHTGDEPFTVARDPFVHALMHAMPARLKGPSTSAQETACKVIYGRISRDPKATSGLTLLDAVVGIFILSVVGGDKAQIESGADAVFKTLDFDHSDSIEEEELSTFHRSFFIVKGRLDRSGATTSATANAAEKEAGDHAAAMTHSVMEKYDLDHDRHLDLAEFLHYLFDVAGHRVTKPTRSKATKHASAMMSQIAPLTSTERANIAKDRAAASVTVDKMEWPATMRAPHWSKPSSETALVALGIAPLEAVGKIESQRLENGAVATFQRMAVGAALLDSTADVQDLDDGDIGIGDDLAVLQLSIDALNNGIQVVDKYSVETREEKEAKLKGAEFWDTVHSGKVQAKVGNASTVQLVDRWRKEAASMHLVCGAPSAKEITTHQETMEKARLGAHAALKKEKEKKDAFDRATDVLQSMRAAHAGVSRAYQQSISHPTAPHDAAHFSLIPPALPPHISPSSSPRRSPSSSSSRPRVYVAAHDLVRKGNPAMARSIIEVEQRERAYYAQLDTARQACNTAAAEDYMQRQREKIDVLFANESESLAAIDATPKNGEMEALQARLLDTWATSLQSVRAQQKEATETNDALEERAAASWQELTTTRAVTTRSSLDREMSERVRTMQGTLRELLRHRAGAFLLTEMGQSDVDALFVAHEALGRPSAMRQCRGEVARLQALQAARSNRFVPQAAAQRSTVVAAKPSSKVRVNRHGSISITSPLPPIIALSGEGDIVRMDETKAVVSPPPKGFSNALLYHPY